MEIDDLADELRHRAYVVSVSKEHQDVLSVVLRRTLGDREIRIYVPSNIYVLSQEVVDEARLLGANIIVNCGRWGGISPAAVSYGRSLRIPIYSEQEFLGVLDGGELL